MCGPFTPYVSQVGKLSSACITNNHVRNVDRKSSNKSLITIIKKVLNENKKSWHVHLKYDLWENWIGTKNSIGTSPFQMVCETDVVLPINMALPVMKLWQDEKEEPNHVTRRINQLIKVHQHRAEVDKRL